MLAVLDKYDINEEIQPGKPLINFFVNKFLPLDILLKDQNIDFQPDISNRNALHYAVEADDIKAVNWLLSKNCPFITDNNSESPLSTAVKYGYQRCFLLLLDNKHYDEELAHTAATYNRVWEL